MYKKNKTQNTESGPESNPNITKATPGVSDDQYENIEGLGEFLFQLNWIIEFLELDKDFFVDIFASENELYVRIHEAKYEHMDSMFGDNHSTRVVKGLEKLYITKILQDADGLELFVDHVKDGTVIQTKVTVTKTGEIQAKNRKPETLPDPFGRLMNMLKRADDRLLWQHPNYYDHCDELFDESTDLLLVESNYETEFNSAAAATENLMRAQKVRAKFESAEKCFVKSGEICHYVWPDEHEQFFLAFRVHGKLHFYLSPIVRRFDYPKSNWISDASCVIELAYQLNYGDDRKGAVKITLDESGIHTEDVE